MRSRFLRFPLPNPWPCAKRRHQAGTRASLLLLAGTALALAGCTHQVTQFSFSSGGKQVTLHTGRSLAKKQQGAFLLSDSSASGPARRTARYALATAQSVGKRGEDFYLAYRPGAGPLELHLFERRAGEKTNTTTRLNLPAAPVERADHAASQAVVRFLVPVAVGTEITAFEVTSSSSQAAIDIHGAGLTRDYRGVQLGSRRLTIRDGAQVTAGGPPTTPNADRVTTIGFRDLVSNLGAAQAQIVFTYTYTHGSGDVYLTARNTSGSSRRYIINLRPGIHRLYLYTASCGFTPQSLEVKTANPGFRVDSVAVHRFAIHRAASNSPGTTKPIPADLGAMLSYQPKWWREKNYELFSWSLVPSVIVMQFRSYAVQARYMKRIAYFVEKWGYTGRLLPSSQLAHLFGWNAHDYRPKDLARFFTKAAKEKFKLGPSEEHLKTILLANGVIKASHGSYTAGKGAILTFAHVGPYWLRWLLLTHEAFHGIFFTHPAYRKAVFSIWDHTSHMEQELFRRVFLAWAGYDIEDMYLVKNEFQAYLMEQPVREADSYFNTAIPRRMKQLKIPESSPLYHYFSSHPDVFRKSAEKVQKAVEAAAGVHAGEDVGLAPY